MRKPRYLCPLCAEPTHSSYLCADCQEVYSGAPQGATKAGYAIGIFLGIVVVGAFIGVLSIMFRG